MTTTPKVPWFVLLAVALAGVGVWEQTVLRKQRREEAAAAQAAAAQKALPPPAPTLETLAPQRGSTFERGAPIEHRWTPIPGVTEYLFDFASPGPDGRCAFDPPRTIAATSVALSHDDASPCTVWRVRAGGGLVAGSSYSVGHSPGCTLPPSAMIGCLEGSASADKQAPPSSE
jgi:hypothetical protein